jgi:hypothetical protein
LNGKSDSILKASASFLKNDLGVTFSYGKTIFHDSFIPGNLFLQAVVYWKETDLMVENLNLCPGLPGFTTM